MLWGSQTAWADGAAERMIQAHPVPTYPATAPLQAGETQVLLSKDPLEQVHRFYKARLQTGDRIETLADQGGLVGYQVVYGETIDGQQKAVTLVEFGARSARDTLHPALGELKAQAMMGKRSQAEYQALEIAYGGLNTAFFRQVPDGQGGTISEGEKIYKATKKRLSPVTVQLSEDERSAGKTQAQELRQKMQEMKARGDVAGLIAMAQQSSGGAKQTRVGAAAMDAYERDIWDEWVACLKALQAAAYSTRLNYHTTRTP